jgi:hypothetical protein
MAMHHGRLSKEAPLKAVRVRVSHPTDGVLLLRVSTTNIWTANPLALLSHVLCAVPMVIKSNYVHDRHCNALDSTRSALKS